MNNTSDAEPDRRRRRSHAAGRLRAPMMSLETLRTALRDPQVEASKFSELVRYEERQAASRARTDFDKAFSQLQTELPAIAERGKLPLEREGRIATYALWEDINSAVKPLLSKFGFAMRFRMEQTADRVSATCYLSHTGGHSEQTTISLPLDLRDGKSGIHAVGSSASYAKRYAACALLNLTSFGEDDDGASASRPPHIDPEQLAELRLKLEAVRGVEAHFAALLGVEALEKLPLSSFRRALATLDAKGAKK